MPQSQAWIYREPVRPRHPPTQPYSQTAHLERLGLGRSGVPLLPQPLNPQPTFSPRQGPPPQHHGPASRQHGLSNAQGIAVIAAGMIAALVIVVIAIALSHGYLVVR